MKSDPADETEAHFISFADLRPSRAIEVRALAAGLRVLCLRVSALCCLRAHEKQPLVYEPGPLSRTLKPQGACGGGCLGPGCADPPMLSSPGRNPRPSFHVYATITFNLGLEVRSAAFLLTRRS